MLTDTALRNLKPESKTYMTRNGMYVKVSPAALGAAIKPVIATEALLS